MKKIQTIAVSFLVLCAIMLGINTNVEAKELQTRAVNKSTGIVKVIAKDKINSYLVGARVMPRIYPYIYFQPRIKDGRKYFNFQENSASTYRVRLMTNNELKTFLGNLR